MLFTILALFIACGEEETKSQEADNQTTVEVTEESLTTSTENTETTTGNQTSTTITTSNSDQVVGEVKTSDDKTDNQSN